MHLTTPAKFKVDVVDAGRDADAAPDRIKESRFNDADATRPRTAFNHGK
jgi:hypothetical protein